jgi:acyl carrier protein
MSDLTLPEIKLEIKKLIIDTLNMRNITPEEIMDDVPLLSGNNVITIESIDILEVVMALQNRFNVRLNDQNIARYIINTINTIADFIYSQQLIKNSRSDS